MIQNKSPPNNLPASEENCTECHELKGPWTRSHPFIPQGFRMLRILAQTGTQTPAVGSKQPGFPVPLPNQDASS